ncbi:unnamed protein product, partial [marine sediment metagenome]
MFSKMDNTPSGGRKMEQKSIIIIGAGIAGLSAGCYSQMNGYHTQIFEMQDEPGGLCTAWKRKDYTFDGCLHSVGGINPNYKLYHYWNDLRKNNKQEYNQEKDRISKEVIEILDQRLGNIKNNIDVIDVATPATFKRYTNNWKGKHP